MKTKFDQQLSEIYSEQVFNTVLLEQHLINEGAIDKLASMFKTTPDKVKSVSKTVGGLVVLIGLLGVGAYFGLSGTSPEVEAKAKDPVVQNAIAELDPSTFEGEPGDPERSPDFTKRPYEGEPGDPEPPSQWSPMKPHTPKEPERSVTDWSAPGNQEAPENLLPAGEPGPPDPGEWREFWKKSDLPAHEKGRAYKVAKKAYLDSLTHIPGVGRD